MPVKQVKQVSFEVRSAGVGCPPSQYSYFCTSKASKQVKQATKRGASVNAKRLVLLIDPYMSLKVLRIER